MKFSQFDRYSPYVKGAALLIALLTYWRFRDINIPAVYAYVAQGDVVHSILFQSAVVTRSIVWDFFGLVDRFLTPHSISLLRGAGFIIMVLDLYLLSRSIDYILGQKLWGFLGMFLAALSPFAVVTAVSGGPAAIAVALTLLFLMALYRNQYIYAGILSGVCFGANLPGLIMFLISILDLLQNLQDRRKMISGLLGTSAGFLGILVLVYSYSTYVGDARLFSVLMGEHDLIWSLEGIVSLFAVNILNLAGIVYLIVKRRYDVYRTHFHTFMLWMTMCALCAVQPSTLNLLVAFTVSIILAMFFIQGFSSLWNIRLVSADTFVFSLVVLFLFGDLYSNNRFLKDFVLEDCYQKSEAVGEVLRTVAGATGGSMLVSNFVPAELSVKLGRHVYAVEGEMLPVGNVEPATTSTIYVATRRTKVDTLSGGCKSLLNTSYVEDKKDYFVQVVECSESK